MGLGARSGWSTSVPSASCQADSGLVQSSEQGTPAVTAARLVGAGVWVLALPAGTHAWRARALSSGLAHGSVPGP